MFRVNKTFLTLQMGILAEFIMFSKGKSISSVSNISSKNISMEKVVQFCQPTTNWLTTQGNGAIPGALRCCLLLADLTLSSSCGQVSFGGWKSMLLNPCIAPINATMATSYMGPLEKTGMAGERG